MSNDIKKISWIKTIQFFSSIIIIIIILSDFSIEWECFLLYLLLHI